MGQEAFGHRMVENGPTVRLIDLSQDYDTIKEWWNDHGNISPGPEHFSKTGLMVEVKGQQICAGFLYNTDSKICLLEFVICNPKAPKESRKIGLEYLIESIKKLAKKTKYDWIYISIGVQSFINKLQDAGFEIVGKDQVHMFYNIGK